MDDLRQKREKEQYFKIKKFLKLKAFFRKRWYIILTILILSIIIIFPSITGEYIGTWIHDFCGNIYKYSKF